VRPDAPPIYIYHGAEDRIVDVSQSKRLASALALAGADVHLEILPDADHWFPFKSKEKETLEMAVLSNIVNDIIPACKRSKALKSGR
jgi:acetyl esterase/lipase